MQELLTLMGKLQLRQEDELAQLRQDKQFLMHMTPTNSPESILGTMYQVALTWKAAKAKSPPTVQNSLRVCLLQCLLLEWELRIQKLTQSTANAAALRQHGWARPSESGTELVWPFQRWSPSAKELEDHPERQGLTTTEVLQIARDLRSLIATRAEGLVHRFHATRKLTETVQGDLPFLLAVSMRGPEADKAHQLLCTLEGSSSLRVIGVSLQQERPKRQPLAEQLQKMLYP